MKANVIAIPALGDNFIYLHVWAEGKACVIDPGESRPVLEALDCKGLRLTTVLLTHRHWDHVGGVSDLVARTGCEVYGADRGLISSAGRTLADGDVVTLGDLRVRAVATPGHTRDALCYYVDSTDADATPVVYTGDTLFVGGCGRLIECDAATMWQSLTRLATLPDETLVYCGHDYTLENYEFAATIAPDDALFRERLEQIQKAVEYGQLTVPSTMAQEKTTNIFLRSPSDGVRTALGMSSAQPAEVFAELRRRKDIFG